MHPPLVRRRIPDTQDRYAPPRPCLTGGVPMTRARAHTGLPLTDTAVVTQHFLYNLHLPGNVYKTYYTWYCGLKRTVLLQSR